MTRGFLHTTSTLILPSSFRRFQGTALLGYPSLGSLFLIHSVAVEPAESPVIGQTMQGKTPMPGPHKIQGIGAGFVPDILDLGLLDEVIAVSSDEAIHYTRLLARQEGLLCGISSGAAVLAASNLAHQDRFQKKTIVVLLPDAGERYLSSALFEGIAG